LNSGVGGRMTQKLKITIVEDGVTREATHVEYIAWLQLEESKHSHHVCYQEAKVGCDKCMMRSICRVICSEQCKSFLKWKNVKIGVVEE